jgi:hypothetical protein
VVKVLKNGHESATTLGQDMADETAVILEILLNTHHVLKSIVLVSINKAVSIRNRNSLGPEFG